VRETVRKDFNQLPGGRRSRRDAEQNIRSNKRSRKENFQGRNNWRKPDARNNRSNRCVPGRTARTKMGTDVLHGEVRTKMELRCQENQS